VLCRITVSGVRGETLCSPAYNDLDTHDYAGVSCSQASWLDAPSPASPEGATMATKEGTAVTVNYKDSKAW